MWKQIKGYESYSISNKGEVKNTVTKKNLKKILTSNGYFIVNLYKNKKAKRFYIHRLVAFNFLETSKNKKQVNHKDDVKTNNVLES